MLTKMTMRGDFYSQMVRGNFHSQKVRESILRAILAKLTLPCDDFYSQPVCASELFLPN